jgi:hypothetical protein
LRLLADRPAILGGLLRGAAKELAGGRSWTARQGEAEAGLDQQAAGDRLPQPRLGDQQRPQPSRQDRQVLSQTIATARNVTASSSSWSPAVGPGVMNCGKKAP